LVGEWCEKRGKCGEDVRGSCGEKNGKMRGKRIV